MFFIKFGKRKNPLDQQQQQQQQQIQQQSKEKKITRFV
jgi:hypothetical protein